MSKLGEWLLRKWNAANKKMVESTKQLDQLGIPEAELRLEWGQQVQQQTKPLARRHLFSCLSFVLFIISFQDDQKILV
jgi:hypothetical protein